MKSSLGEKASIKEKGLRYYLLIIEFLVVVIPFVILFYIFYTENAFLESSKMILIALTLVLILSGLMILRQIFDRFSLVAISLKKAEGGEKALIRVQQDTTELQEIAGSFNNLMNRLEETTSELQYKVFELFTIKELTEVASRSLDIEELLNMLLEKTMAVSKAQTGSVLMVESDKNQFRVVTTKGLDPGPGKGSHININDTLLQHMVSEKKPFLVQDIASDPRTRKVNDLKYGAPSFLSMPIFIREDLIGVLNLSRKQTQQVFDSHDEHIVSIMIGEIGFALENARLHLQVVEHVKNLEQATVELTNANDQLRQEITERKQLEVEIEDTNKFLKNILDSSSSISIVSTDLEQNVLFWNKGAENIFGYKAEEIVGRQKINILYPDEETKEIVNEIRSIIMKNKKNVSKEVKEITREGRTLWVNLNLTPSFDERGNVIGIFGIGEDITERKKMDEEIRESEEKLARSKKMESLGLLAGGVAHDLNNVLSGIVSYPDLLLMDLPEDSKLRKPIETMQESGQRAAAIVQDLLTVARGIATTKEPLNLNVIVNNYLVSPEFKQLKQFHPTVTVKTDLDIDLFNIGGSHVHIRKVVMNLVSNASEAIEGGGNVTISTMNRYIDRPLRGYDEVTIGEYAVLAVSDDGSGISSDDLERIFEPFYTKKVMSRSGTGLGLAVVWNVVQDHKGYIDVTSDENGTTFELYFPITRDEISEKDLSIPIKDYKGNGETILVVDDVESQREISCSMLDTLGYKTKAVSSGEEAVEYLKENTVDLLLLDMIMDPGINGRETYERIIKIHPNQKAIIVSGFAETDEVKKTQKLGAGKYIKKPITLKKIGLAVKEELDR